MEEEKKAIMENAITIEEKEREKEAIIENATTIVNKIIKNLNCSIEEAEKIIDDTLNNSQTMFNIVCSYQERFIRDELRPIDFYYTTLDRLTGVYMYLSPITLTLDSFINRHLLKFYHIRKIDTISKGEKFVSAPVEKESEYYVSILKVKYCIFAGFLDDCMQAIMTCKKRVESTKNEKDISK